MPKKELDPNQLGLFRGPDSIDKTVQEAASQEKPKAEEPLAIDLNRKEQKYPYHIMKGYLRTLDYNTLQNIFYGMHQVSVPQKMKEAMNPIEILALYCGAQGFKRKFDEWPEFECGVTAEEIVSNFVSGALGKNPCLAGWQNRAKRFYSTEKGGMKERINALDDKTKNTFLNSAKERRKFSNAENSWKNNFYDPNCDGDSREVYVVYILDRIKK